jgi:hypothetical protein
VRRIAWTAGAALLLAALPAAAQHALHELEINGPSDNRIDFLIMGDGYTAAEQEAFLADAEGVIDGVFAQPPFAPYRPFFDFRAIASVSAESGSDHPSDGVDADTAFGCGFECFDIDRLICCDDAAVFAAADALAPEHDAILLLVNDPEYGGSGGAYAIASLSFWTEAMVMHELGHSFAGLADEYEDPYPGFPFEDVYPNVSTTWGPGDLKWAAFVEDDTPLPTPEPDPIVDPLGPVGAYEGACYQSTGLYRPVPACLMRTLENGPCPVCAQALVLAYHGYVELIDAAAPADDSVSGAVGDVLDFAVDAVEPVPTTIAYDWLLDGESIGDAAALALPIECLAPGAHALVAEVRDETDLVFEIYDPEELLFASRAWTVTRTDDGAVVDCFDEAPGDTDSEADAGADAGPTGSGDDGCGCAAAGGPPPPALLRALLG